MWNTDTPWFLKVALFAGMTAGFSSFGLRWVGWALMGVAIVGAGYLHLRWLPSHGINGWTGEPKEKYYKLMDTTRRGHPKLRAFIPSATEKGNLKN
jgi:hypothetical protein